MSQNTTFNVIAFFLVYHKITNYGKGIFMMKKYYAILVLSVIIDLLSHGIIPPWEI